MVHSPCARLHTGLDWNDLRYFLAVSSAGTLVGAARELGVEHTTVSRRLAALERALETRLFIRGPEGLTLTAAGVDLLAPAEEMQRNADAIERLVAGQDQKIEGQVRLTIPEAMNTYALQALAGLRERHPGLLVEVLSDNRDLDIRRGEADLAIRIRDIADPDLIGRRIGSSTWALYAAPAYIERKGSISSADQLRGHDLIQYDASLARIPGAVWLAAHAHEANVVVRGNSVAAVSDAATIGFGIAALPCFLGDHNPALRRFYPERIGAADIMLVVHPDLARVARVRATMDFIVELFVRDAALFTGEAS